MYILWNLYRLMHENVQNDIQLVKELIMTRFIKADIFKK